LEGGVKNMIEVKEDLVSFNA